MGSSVSIALWGYFIPLTSARAVRLGFFLFLLTAAMIGFAFSLGYLARVFPILPENASQRALNGLRLFLITPGVAIAAILFSEMPLRDGIRQRTLLYPLLGPVSRTTLAVVRTAATGMLLAGASAAVVLVIRILEGNTGPLVRELWAVTLSALAYTAAFGLLHVITRRGLFAGLAFLILFDAPLSQLPFGIRRLSLSYHTRVLADTLVEMQLPVAIMPPEASVLGSTLTLILVAAALTAATAYVFSRKRLGELC
jgi:ABC-2 type transport system permease protein